jgi:intracellular sulfur oxidation DsrE/DsrF family protein
MKAKTLGLCLVMASASWLTGCANTPLPKEHVAFSVSDKEAGKWNLALNNASNAQKSLGKDKVDIEIVVFGPGINMLKADSTASNRIDQAIKNGVKIVACENSMTNFKLAKADMNPNISYVPGGVVELMRLQKAGWAYVRP